jgi:hypothetical protein
MPMYKNSTSAVITVNGNRIEPNETITTLEFLENLPAGVTQEQSTPSFTPCKYSNEFKGGSGDSGSINVPAGLVQYTVVVTCSAGAIKFETNGNTTANTAEVVVAGESVKYQCMSRMIDSFKIYYLETGSICKVSIA